MAAQPELQDQQRPDFFAVIGGAGVMLVKQTPDDLRLKQSLLSQPTFPQQFLHQGPEQSLEPQGGGNQEAPFLAAQDGLGRMSLKAFFSRYFLLPCLIFIR